MILFLNSFPFLGSDFKEIAQLRRRRIRGLGPPNKHRNTRFPIFRKTSFSHLAARCSFVGYGKWANVRTKAQLAGYGK